MNATALRAGIVAVSLLVVWRVLQVNVVLFDESGRPRIPAASPAGDAAASDRAVLKRALEENPGQVDALLLLAGENERAGDARDARRAYQAAFQLAPMDREVLGAGAEFALRQGATAEAISLLDRLVEGHPDAGPRAFPALGRLLAERRDPESWNAIAARQPSWLGSFIVSACRQGIDPAFLVPLFMGRLAAGRATGEQSGCLIDRLRETDRWQEAYHLWLNTLPRERLQQVGHVFNGGFEYAPTGVGFDWRVTTARERDAGHSVEMPQGLGVTGKRALRVSFNGKRQVGIPIAQFLALPPGRYQLAGLARSQSITAGRGIQWVVRCVKGGKLQAPLAASERFVGSSEWRAFTFDVTVPAGCEGQVLQIEPVGEGAVYLAGSAWFDELVLRRRG